MRKTLAFLLTMLSAGLFLACDGNTAADPVPSSRWLIISPSSASMYVGDEYEINPKFSDDEAKDFDYEWTVSDSSHHFYRAEQPFPSPSPRPRAR